jgi:hypothetical protein
MTDTDVTFLPNYNNMDLSTDLARLYTTMLTSPPSLPCSRLLARLGVRWPSQSHPVIQRLPVLQSSNHYLSNSRSVPGYKTNLLLISRSRVPQQIGSCPLTRLDPYLASSPVSPLTSDKVRLRVHLPPRTPRLRVCHSQNHSHQSSSSRVVVRVVLLHYARSATHRPNLT